MTFPAKSASVIRAAMRADIETIAAFNAAMALETERKTLDPETLRAGVSAVFDDPARGFYRVTQVDGVVVACLLITFEWSDWRNGNWWWLQSVYVRPDHRGQGVFGAMYRAVRVEAHEAKGVCGLRLFVEEENLAAQRVYERLGMAREAYRIFHERFRVESS